MKGSSKTVKRSSKTAKGSSHLRNAFFAVLLLQLSACGSFSDRLGDRIEQALLDRGIDAISLAESVHDSVGELADASLDDLQLLSRSEPDDERYLLLSAVELSSETDVELLMGSKDIQRF